MATGESTLDGCRPPIATAGRTEGRPLPANSDRSAALWRPLPANSDRSTAMATLMAEISSGSWLLLTRNGRHSWPTVAIARQRSLLLSNGRYYWPEVVVIGHERPCWPTGAITGQRRHHGARVAMAARGRH